MDIDHVPLDGPSGGRQFEYDDIYVNDVVMSEIPWFVSGSAGQSLPYFSLILIPMWNPFSLPKQHPPTTICDQQWSKTSHNTSGCKQIDPLNITSLGGALIWGN